MFFVFNQVKILNNSSRLFSLSSIVNAPEIVPPSNNTFYSYSRIIFFYLFFLEFQIDLPGVENYGFEGESSFMRCKHGAVAADSDEASKVGR